MSDWRSDVLKFWFALKPAQWFRTDPALDDQVRERFCKLWAEKRQLPVDSFLADSLTALAGVVLFDQFPRNMFRGHAEQFATDELALGIAKGAVDKGLDRDLQPKERSFLYMSSGLKSCISNPLIHTTSPALKRPWLQPHTVKIIAPAIITFVISDWPMLSQASETSFRTAARVKEPMASS